MSLLEVVGSRNLALAEDLLVVPTETLSRAKLASMGHPSALSATEAQEKFSELLRRVAADEERIILTRAGEELVAVIPVEDLALVEALEDRADIEDARDALREAREKGKTSLADLKALLDKIATELRDAPTLSDEAVSRAEIYAERF